MTTTADRVRRLTAKVESLPSEQLFEVYILIDKKQRQVSVRLPGVAGHRTFTWGERDGIGSYVEALAIARDWAFEELSGVKDQARKACDLIDECFEMLELPGRVQQRLAKLRKLLDQGEAGLSKK